MNQLVRLENMERIVNWIVIVKIIRHVMQVQVNVSVQGVGKARNVMRNVIMVSMALDASKFVRNFTKIIALVIM